ncbi:hypothetical protein M885DRAFT_589980 [Pelagophyceae sp. CCMP2097]|nr:hypothetical protein M885DRAFT_589980 [Pelagophyceae sp. CCMP2097]
MAQRVAPGHTMSQRRGSRAAHGDAQLWARILAFCSDASAARAVSLVNRCGSEASWCEALDSWAAARPRFERPPLCAAKAMCCVAVICGGVEAAASHRCKRAAARAAFFVGDAARSSTRAADDDDENEGAADDSDRACQRANGALCLSTGFFNVLATVFVLAASAELAATADLAAVAETATAGGHAAGGGAAGLGARWRLAEAAAWALARLVDSGPPSAGGDDERRTILERTGAIAACVDVLRETQPSGAVPSPAGVTAARLRCAAASLLGRAEDLPRRPGAAGEARHLSLLLSFACDDAHVLPGDAVAALARRDAAAAVTRLAFGAAPDERCAVAAAVVARCIAARAGGAEAAAGGRKRGRRTMLGGACALARCSPAAFAVLGRLARAIPNELARAGAVDACARALDAALPPRHRRSRRASNKAGDGQVGDGHDRGDESESDGAAAPRPHTSAAAWSVSGDAARSLGRLAKRSALRRTGQDLRADVLAAVPIGVFVHACRSAARSEKGAARESDAARDSAAHKAASALGDLAFGSAQNRSDLVAAGAVDALVAALASRERRGGATQALAAALAAVAGSPALGEMLASRAGRSDLAQRSPNAADDESYDESFDSSDADDADDADDNADDSDDSSSSEDVSEEASAAEASAADSANDFDSE